jgi:hypothetical protein
MTKENRLIHDKHEHAENMNWQRVLAFGPEVVKPKAGNRLHRPYASVFAVLP